MTIQQTLILIKPDGVKRGLIGKIITRIEDTGLKVCALKMIWPDEKLTEKHYPLDEEWARGVFDKAKGAADKDGKKFEYSSYKEYGKYIQDLNKNFLKESPVAVMVIKGPHAIEIIRKMVGATEPRTALPGTIRGDLASIESYERCNKDKRAVRNLMHASDTLKSAEREIALWFKPNEIHDYKREDKHFQ
ncbi:MAG: nucleoside-diphosphate kinase [archaeon]